MKPFFWFGLVKSLMLSIPSVERLCPRQGTILDLGCGNGYITHYLARHGPHRFLIGYDWYARRLAAARTLPPLANCRFRVGDLHAALAAPEPIDHILLIDVLYLLPPDAQDKILRSCWARLPEGGSLILKVNNTTPRWKYRWARFQETVAVRGFRVSKSAHTAFAFRPAAAYVEQLSALGGAVAVHRIDRWRPYPDVVCIATKGRPRDA